MPLPYGASSLETDYRVRIPGIGCSLDTGSTPVASTMDASRYGSDADRDGVCTGRSCTNRTAHLGSGSVQDVGVSVPGHSINRETQASGISLVVFDKQD